MELQTTLLQFMLQVPLHFIPLTREYAERKGLSERLIRRMLERQGWLVWRASSIGAHTRPDAWPNVKRKYGMLEGLLPQGQHAYLTYLNTVHHGLPDYLCHRRGEWKFVECKMGHEQLLESQERCIPKLQARGFPVEVFVLAEPCTKARRGTLHLDTRAKEVHDRQLRLKRRWKRR